MQLFDFFDIFGSLFGSFFLLFFLVPVIVFIVIVVVIVKSCQQGTSRRGGFVIEPPTFVIPEGYQGRRRTDGTEIKTVRLPERCPSCGAALSHEGIDWIGPLEARCNYCGGTVKARFETV
ncbi:MAG: hypothetical protein ACFFEF_17665 [Candidatus Thorarchaeota archaeon]